MSTFYKLSVKEIHKETENSVSIVFDIPDYLKNAFDFTPGQYINIKKELNGEELRRAYSICSSRKSGEIRIGIKAVEGGTFSVYATSQLKVGDVLEVSPPEGRFTLQIDPNNKQNYLAFAAGSGITPILSMIKSVLEEEVKSSFVLVYGNKKPSYTMFKKEIDELSAAFSNRFSVHYVYSQSNEENTLFGRIDTSISNFIIKNKHKETSFDEVFLCGPELMIQQLKEQLITNGFTENNVHFELFTAKEIPMTNECIEGTSTITILLDDEETTLSMPREKTILETALTNGLDAPFSCQGGICSSCLAKVTEGKAIMDKNTILTDKEVEEGLVLTCQAHPVTDTITIDYDNV
jgi:ring-1,2-phenylacetyl-CoA epoxidase subunit PaaE